MEGAAIRVFAMPAFNSTKNVGASIRKASDSFELHLCYCNTKVGNSQRKHLAIPLAIPETAISVAVAATAVGAAAALLARRTKPRETIEVPTKTCEDCGGSGVCPECKGEGFVLRRPSEESAERARLNSKSLATRYTAGLPKKWSYCTKCTSSRSCKTCEGRGKLISQ